jgi:hypothetical protein
MPMRRDSISVRHLQTYGVIAVKSERITLHHGKLRSRKQKRRSGTIFDLVRCKRLFSSEAEAAIAISALNLMMQQIAANVTRSKQRFRFIRPRSSSFHSWTTIVQSECDLLFISDCGKAAVFAPVAGNGPAPCSGAKSYNPATSEQYAHFRRIKARTVRDCNAGGSRWNGRSLSGARHQARPERRHQSTAGAFVRSF